MFGQRVKSRRIKSKNNSEWNGYRPPIQLLTKEFRRWLVQKEYNQRVANRKKKYFRPASKLSNTYSWIENLIQIPLEDYRKYCIFHILVPYLVNVKVLSTEEVSRVIIDWLSRCNKMQSLDFNPSTEIKNRIKYVKNFKPMSLVKLQTENKDLYRLLTNKSA